VAAIASVANTGERIANVSPVTLSAAPAPAFNKKVTAKANPRLIIFCLCIPISHFLVIAVPLSTLRTDLITPLL
jgi:hypothetical protein